MLGQKPNLREMVGVAMQASVLVIEARRSETPLLRVAAVGAAANQVARNADAPLYMVAASAPAATTDRNRIEAKLAPLLWRLKYAGRPGTSSAIEASRLFAVWMMGTRTWRDHPPTEEFAQRFAACVLREWLNDRCPGCGGTGAQELLRSGHTRRPQRFNDRSVRHVACRACGGSGRGRPNALERARALDVPTIEVRDTWALRLDKAGDHLRFIARRLTRPLRLQLERG